MEFLRKKKKDNRNTLTESSHSAGSNLVRQLLNRYPKVEDFLVSFNPYAQYLISRDDCFFGKYPLLCEVDEAYGNNASIQFIYAQLVNLSEFSGSNGKLSPEQIKELSFLIRINYYYYKVTELMQFFFQFKSGKYGHFYGNVDPLAITESLYKFNRERLFIIGKREEEEARKRIDDSRKNAVSFESAMLSFMERAAENGVVSIAKSIISNKFKASDETIKKLRDKFIESYGVSPEEYAEKEESKG